MTEITLASGHEIRLEGRTIRSEDKTCKTGRVRLASRAAPVSLEPAALSVALSERAVRVAGRKRAVLDTGAAEVVSGMIAGAVEQIGAVREASGSRAAEAVLRLATVRLDAALGRMVRATEGEADGRRPVTREIAETTRDGLAPLPPVC